MAGIPIPKHDCATCGALTKKLAKELARNAELEKVIEEAPHSKDCLYRWSVEGGYDYKSECSCFKSKI